VSLYFLGTDREWRPIQSALIVSVGDEKLWSTVSNRLQVSGILYAHLFGQSDQGSAVIHGIDRTETLARQLEQVASKEIYVLCAVATHRSVY